MSRHSCKQCNKPLASVNQVSTKRISSREGYHTETVKGPLIGYGYSGRGHFCSLRCGWKFALDVVEGRRTFSGRNG